MKKINVYPCRAIASYLMLPVFLLLLLSGKAQPAHLQSLLALSKANHTLAVVDAATLQVVARIPVGEDPHEVVASADGKTAYVSIYGGGSLHELDVIDLLAQKPLASVDTKPLFGPHGLTFVNGKLWFTAEGSKAVGRYDPATHQTDWSMGTGQDRTHMIYVTNNGKRIYTTNVSSGTVSILVDTMMPPNHFPPPPDNRIHGSNGAPPRNMPPPGGGGPHENWEQTIIATSPGSEGFDISPDSIELWTASAEDGSITIINVKAKKLITKIDAKVNGANRLKFTPDGKLVFISSLSDGALSVFDAKTRKLVKHIDIGHGAAGILMQPDGSRAFVACTADNNIAVINLSTLTVSGHIDVGGEPDGLGWAERE